MKNFCEICKCNNIYELIDLGEQPFANKYPNEAELKSKKYNLKILMCLKCKQRLPTLWRQGPQCLKIIFIFLL